MKRVELFQQLLDAVTATESIDSAYMRLAEVVSLETGFPIVAITQYDRIKEMLRFKGHYGVAANVAQKFDAVPVSSLISEELLRSGMPLFDRAVDQRTDRPNSPLHAVGAKSVLMVPMTLRGAVQGMLALVDTKVFDPSQEDIELYCSLGVFLASLIEQKRVQHELLYKTDLLDRVQEIGRLGSFELDLKTKKVIWSKSMFEITGVAPPEGGELTSDFVDSLLRDKDANSFRHRIQEAIISGAHEFEQEIAWPNGVTGWFWFKSRIENDERGEPAKLVGFMNDITGRKLVEIDLRRKMRELSAVERVVHMGTYALDMKNDRWTSSLVLDEIFGIDNNFIRNFDAWLSLVHPDDREMMSQYFSELVASGGRFDHEYRIVRHKDGAIRWVWGMGEFEFDENNKPTMISGGIQDVTEKKAIQAQLIKQAELVRQVLDASMDWIYVKDRDMRFILANEAFARLRQVPIDQILGTIQEDREERAVFEGKILRNEAETLSLKGETRIFETTRIPLHDEKGGIFGVLAIGRDLTDRIKAEKEREQIRNRLVHSEKLASIGTLAAGVAHEINNPLQIIRGYSEVLASTIREGTAGVRELTLIDKQVDAVNRIAKIVDGLRVFSRRDTDESELLNVIDVIKDIFAFCEGLYRKQNITMEPALAENALYVFGHRGRLQQVLLNVITNARDALEGKRDGKISVEAFHQNDRIILRISDNGAGISKEDIRQLFHPFFTTKPPGKGVGLGLSISQGIITSIGGVISVESEVGRGTTVIIEMPKIDPERVTAAGQLVMKKLPKGLRVLIVDDQAEMLEVMEGYLRQLGVAADRASDGAEALERLKKRDYDIVLTDLQMPRMGGAELLNEAKLGGISSKFIAFTGALMGESSPQIATINQLGFASVLIKPFDAKILAEALISAISADEK